MDYRILRPILPDEFDLASLVIGSLLAGARRIEVGLGMILEGVGCQLQATGNGFEALRWLEERAYDLLIVGAKLPEVDGPTLYREVLARWPTGGLRVLFVPGFAEPSDCEDALNAQDVPVLFTPFRIDGLGAVLDRVLATV